MRHIARHCPSCEGTNLVAGDYLSNLWWGLWWRRFLPSDTHTYLGFSVVDFACRDCGLISRYVTDECFRKSRPDEAQNLGTFLNDGR